MKIEYKHFRIKKRKGVYRQIYAPSDSLKKYQLELLTKLYEVKPHDSNHGFVPNRSIVTNAIPHLKKKFILSMDIKNFFPNTTTNKVKNIFNKWYPDLIKEMPFVIYKNHLPQGAPTSPYLANFALYDFDNSVTAFCNEYNLSYTRYADDLCISGEYLNLKQILIFINTELNKYDYFLSKRKTKIMPWYKRQKVTGIVVNQKLSIPREIKNQLRAYNHLHQNGKWNTNDVQFLAGLNGYKCMTNINSGK